MDAGRMGRLVGDLRRFLQLFDDCFARREGREHLQRYVHGQFSNIRRKCVEPMADACGIAPRTLQDFLATHTWDHERALDRLQQSVAEVHSCDEAIGLIDETSFPKRGDKTAGVQRQYCGATGKIDNCIVTVGLGYADLRGRFRCTLDHRLFLPQSWDNDRARCRGGVEPMVLQKEHHSKPTGGRRRHFPRLAAQSAKPNRVDRLCTYSYLMRDQPWQDFHIKDGHKGPIVWRAKATRFRMNVRPQNAGKNFPLPSAPAWLIVARHPMTGEIKYFVSNAPATTPVERMLHVSFSRWHIERCFQDEKGLLGLDHFECRRYHAVQRHLILTIISHLFLARVRLQLIDEDLAQGEKTVDLAAGSPSREYIDSGLRPDAVSTTRTACVYR